MKLLKVVEDRSAGVGFWNLAEVIRDAWREVRKTHELDPAKRSEMWVDVLARRFESHYAKEDVRVFWKGYAGNRKEFSLNELLFDILVCRVGKTCSFQSRDKQLEFISQCYWQIESEFNRKNSRNLVVDMSKLVMGAAPNKLLVASHRGAGGEDAATSSRAHGRAPATEKDVLDQLAPIAAHCTGNLFLCFLSHPEEWKSGADPTLLVWAFNRWMQLGDLELEAEEDS